MHVWTSISAAIGRKYKDLEIGPGVPIRLSKRGLEDVFSEDHVFVIELERWVAISPERQVADDSGEIVKNEPVRKILPVYVPAVIAFDYNFFRTFVFEQTGDLFEHDGLWVSDPDAFWSRSLREAFQRGAQHDLASRLKADVVEQRVALREAATTAGFVCLEQTEFRERLRGELARRFQGNEISFVDETLANDDAAVLGRALDFLEAEGYPILRDGK